MGDALLRIVDVEQPDAVADATGAHRLQERRALRIGSSRCGGLRRDGVVLHENVRSAAAPRGFDICELLEGVRRVQLMQHVPSI